MPRAYDPNLEPEVAFYRVTDADLTGKPGDLIRYEKLDGVHDAEAAPAEAGVTYRVLYQSLSGLGDENANPIDTPIAVSGLIAFPPGNAPPGGWPVLSWAHGTVGSADHSAPSMDPYVAQMRPRPGLGLLRKINKAPHQLLNSFLREGWAVAMTDYEGLGTYGTHPYLLGRSEGRGIIDIVPALRQLAAKTVEQRISERYAIVGHSQGGQAALWGAHLASTNTYASTAGTLIGVAALAPASNLTEGLENLRLAYASNKPIDDLSGFYVLFCNGAFGGDLSVENARDQIFQPAAVTQYDRDANSKSRAELSRETFWTTRPPLAGAPNWEDGIFRVQSLVGIWAKYWRQVANFNPAKPITVPIRISQAEHDQRVKAPKTRQLIGQLDDLNGANRVEPKFYDSKKPEEVLPTPDPDELGEHFGLLIHQPEIDAIISWLEGL